jgi:phosphohistidine swiveling domain-containing protein
MNTVVAETLRWDPPGKGDWRGLHDHFPRALTPEYQRLLADGMEHGEAVWMEAYGLPARSIAPEFIHGRVFISAVPLVGPRSDRVPPTWLMRAVVAVAPPFRRRVKAAEQAVRDRPWLAEARHWWEVEEAHWATGNEARQSVDPDALDDDALVEHLTDVRAWATDGYRAHFRLHGPDLVPIGRLLAGAQRWGLDPVAVAGLLAGSSPISRGDQAPPDWCLVTGYDLDSLAAVELPARPGAQPAGGHPRTHTHTHSHDEAEAAMREQVPTDERAHWDELLADARTTYGVRDSNGLLTAAWPVGLLRRALLAAGRRLHERGALAAPEHAIELTVDEVVALITADPSALGADDVAARAEHRRMLSGHAAPPSLGPSQDLPLDALPPAMRDMSAAVMGIRDFGILAEADAQPLHGIGINSGATTEPVTGRACVADDPADAFARFEPGDIMVTAGTCPAWNAILAHAGGVVTEEGGPLSHAAVIARELGLPAIIGCADALSRIPDGATIELDATTGAVRVLADA